MLFYQKNTILFTKTISPESKKRECDCESESVFWGKIMPKMANLVKKRPKSSQIYKKNINKIKML